MQELIVTNAQRVNVPAALLSESSWTLRCEAKSIYLFFFTLLPGTAAFTELIEKCNIIHLQEKLMKFAGSGNVLQKANSHLNMHEKGAQCDPS